MAAVVLLGWLLRRTPFGLRLYLMGTNQRAAFYAGIPRERMLILTYTMCGILASLAGLVSVSHTLSAKWDYGNSYLLIAILIAVMGGVNPAGGYGRIICVFFAATVLQFLSSLFNLLGVSQFFGDCAWGFLLLLSLAFAGGARVRAIFGMGVSRQQAGGKREASG
jgi:simple sugar transport system permease protein